ncbi:cysteine-rich protein with zinc finger domain [Cryptosporidium ubiquitum]|uniref:Cysteine-rich protein with zinc finger domain n=1 Tax=Cryptosporidium ubiquitum TaxID=857276 RepID=A0A1J4MKP8_9CRYT|nr:cysteine-rich protein with zinc finger domain [Cryptosporidium ubiquitum]OII73437.1 cysteine-rich protein with zinc finger domain [Cryptosporidium ubiquitum]
MDDIYLAEFHGFIDEKTWEIAKLSIHYLDTLKENTFKVFNNGGILEKYSHLRDLIEIVRICVLHGILIGINHLEKTQEIYEYDYGSLYHFVKIFPELNELGKVDDMCFLSFLLMNKVFTGFLESIKNPLSKWNQRITMYYHHASILRYNEFLKEFIFIISSFENCLRIKNFHIPSNWMTHFAKLSLRWNNFGNDQTEISFINENFGNINHKKFHREDNDKKFVRNNPNLSDIEFDSKSSLNILLRQEFEQNFSLNDYNIYDDRNFISKSSILNSNATIITDYNSNCDLNHDMFADDDRTVVYNEGNIQDIEELLGNMWGPIFDYSPVSGEIGLDNNENQGNYDNNKKKILEIEDKKDNMNINSTQNDFFNAYIERENTENIDNHLLLGKKTDLSYFKINYELKLMRNDIDDTRERYLYYYHIPLNKQEERLILELQNYKCFTNHCESRLEFDEESKLNFCCFTGYFYCDHCFGPNTCSILPGLLAKYGNLTPVPVSFKSKEKLKSLENIPLIKINSLTAEIWESNKYIKQLVYLKSYLSSLLVLKDFDDKERDNHNIQIPVNNYKIKCQYKESIKRRIMREYDMVYQFGRYDYFSVRQLTEIAYEIFSQEVTMYSNETNLQSIVKEMAKIAVNWRKHLSKCIHCQYQNKNSKDSILCLKE